MVHQINSRGVQQELHGGVIDGAKNSAGGKNSAESLSKGASSKSKLPPSGKGAPTDGSSSYTSHELDFFSFSRLCKKRNILKVK